MDGSEIKIMPKHKELPLSDKEMLTLENLLASNEFEEEFGFALDTLKPRSHIP